jgi:dTDP-4-dehydrorhamnose 3,5-epimerase
MIFTGTKLNGAFIIEPEKLEDERGFFARNWDQNEFEQHGLNSKLVQCNISFNKKKGTLRGIHFQSKPYEESKLVRCTKGKIYDVIIDLRPNSKTFLQWLGIELSENNHQSLFIPEGFGHGFQTLEDNTEVFYQMSQYYHPKYSGGIMWNDEYFKIKWPIKNLIISEKDSLYTKFIE